MSIPKKHQRIHLFAFRLIESDNMKEKTKQKRNRIISIREWLERNKIFFEVFSYLFIGAITVLLTCVSINLTQQQTEIQKQQAILIKNERQPIFMVTFPLQKLSNTEKFDTETIEIYNNGNIFKRLDFDIQMFYNLEYKIPKQNINESYYIPIRGYYFAQFRFQSFTGKLVEGFLKNNHLNFIRIYNETIEKSKDETYYFIKKITLTKLYYQDIDNDYDTIYFNNGSEINKSEYDDIVSLSKKHFENFYENDLEKINLNNVMQHIQKIKGRI